MNPLPTVARLCTLLLTLAAVACSSEEDDPGTDSNVAGGSNVSKGGANSSSSAPHTRVQAGGATGFSGTKNIAGANQGAAGDSFGQGGAATVPSTAGAAGVGFVTGTGGVGTATGVVGTGTGGVIGAAGAATGGTDTGQSFTISGTVAGLSGTGLSLSLSSGNPLKPIATIPVAADGAFTAPIQIPAGTAVKLGIATQPTGPHQSCTVSESGTIATLTSNVTNIAVTCVTTAHAVGGNIAGLLGSGLVLQINGGEELAMGGNGRFAFPTKILSGLPFTVTVKSQPNAPNQTCSISGGSGIVGALDVPTVAVNCSTNSFLVGGTISGLAGTGLTLLNNGVDSVRVTANGSFAFATPVLSGGAFAVTIQSQPVDPVQTCVLGSATGTVSNSNVASVAVSCTTNTYAVRGNVTGLVGSGLTLQNNLTDNLALSADGAFSFSTKLASGSDYAVSVQAQPTTPAQDCVVSNGSGKLTASDVANVQVTCTTKKYSVGGSVSGMASTGLVLRNNGGDDITINSVGPFTFPTQVDSGKTFAVTIAAQPNGEFCSIGGNSGTIGTANVDTVRINCSDKAYLIGGTLSGLEGSGLQLALNGKAPQAFTANGSFAFTDLLAKGDTYSVSIAQMPTSPWQTCALKNDQGTVGTTNVSDVEVTCTTNSYTVGGTITGLVSGAEVVLRNNGGDDLTVKADGAFTFPTPVLSNKPYQVTVYADPSAPAQTCTVANAGGTVGGSNIANISVTCRTNTYSVSGTISGLVGSVVLANNTTDTLTLTANGTFKFAGPIASGMGYDIKVIAPPMTPAAQDCTVRDGTGTVTNADVSNVTIVCVTKEFSIGGRVTGLASGEQLILQNNGGDNLTVQADGSFTFATRVASAQSYSVTLLSMPLAQNCAVSGGVGTVGSADVTSISVNCSTLRIVGGTVTGASGSSGLVLRNGGEDLPVTVPGTFAFKTPLVDGTAYDVSVLSQPVSPWQTCTVMNGRGVVSGGDIKSITVACIPDAHTVNVNVTGLVNGSTGLVLQNNNADNLSVTKDGVFPFASKISSGDTYSVKVLTQPNAPSQTCTVSAETGKIGNADVTVNVSCVANNFTIGGTVYGYVGNGLVLRNNGGNDLSISSTGTFTFTQPVGAGTNYAVTVATHPNGFRCAVSSGTGTVGSANVTTVRVDCPAFTFDADVEGWLVKNGAAGLTWTGSVGSPDAGALQYQAPSASCGQVMLEVNPAQKGIKLDGSGKTESVWVRFDTLPSTPASGSVVLYAQGSNWDWSSESYPISSFTAGVWKQLTHALPSGSLWNGMQALGLRIEVSGGTCQAMKFYVDSVQLR